MLLERATIDEAVDTTKPAATAEISAEIVPEWGPVKKILYRFLFIYLVLYSFPFPLYYIPYVDVAVQPWFDMWNALVPWVGKHLFQVEITVQPNGSGDTTFNYVELVCFFAFSAIGALIWTLLDRRRRNYVRLNDWLRLYVRLVLGVAMISYGTFKVIQSQFPSPSVDRLMQPFGDASPMGILWTFMGASTAYNFFAGAVEMLGGLLVAARRTALLGALVSIAAMGNIVVLNFSYDVPVKLYSLHLLAMAVYIAAADLRRLVDLFLLNRPAEPALMRPLFRRRWLNRLSVVLGTVFILAVTGLGLYQSYTNRTSYGSPTSKSPFYGTWNVVELKIDDVDRPPLITDETRWRRVIFDYPSTIAVQLMSDTRQRYRLALDPKKKQFALTKRDTPDWKADLTYRRPARDHLVLEGLFDGHRMEAHLRLTKPKEFLLVTRGFHWINETPFNR